MVEGHSAEAGQDCLLVLENGPDRDTLPTHDPGDEGL